MKHVFYKITSAFVLIVFVLGCVMPPQGFAQTVSAIGLMPAPGIAVPLTPAYDPAQLKGMVINANDPFKFDFIISRGQEKLTLDEKQAEYQKLIKYFLASLAIPDAEQWVNLSPYEQERIIPDNFGLTEMGRDLLAQDYLLKQIAASLTNPDTELGKKFWEGVYEKAYEKFGTTDIPTDVFNKVWITPDKAVVYEKGNSVIILEHHLKVQMESDYRAMQANGAEGEKGADNEAVKISKQVMREVIIPAIEKEVNEGKSFAPVRQVYSGMLLATWYKMALKESILGKLYADKSKVKGVDQDPKNNQEIFNQYVKAFNTGVFNMIKEDVDRYSQEIIPRKYFSGGIINPGREGVEVRTKLSSRDMAVLSEEISKYDSAQVTLMKSIDNAARNSSNKSQSSLRKWVAALVAAGILIALGFNRADQIKQGLDSLMNIPTNLLEVGGALNQIRDETVTGMHQAFVNDQLKKEIMKELGWKNDKAQAPGIKKLIVIFILMAGVAYSAMMVKSYSPSEFSLLKFTTKLTTEYISPGPINGFLREAEEAIFVYNQSLIKDVNEAGKLQNPDETQKVDNAASYGGIDMNAASLDMQIKRDGKGVPLPVSQQNLENIQIEGLIPVILNIQPAIGVQIFQ